MEGFADEVRRFIRRVVDSVELLEVLLLLRSSRRSWGVEELTAELRSSQTAIGARLSRLRRSGLLRSDGDRVAYEASSADDATVAEVAALYRERRIAVIEAIYSPAPSNALQTFSDAFRIGGEGEDG